jgi:hypothetical protein
MEGYENNLKNKVPVMGLLNRETRQVRAKVIPNVKRETLQTEILLFVTTERHRLERSGCLRRRSAIEVLDR